MANKIIIGLVLVILILGSVLSYFLLVKPAIENYAQEKQIEGVQIFVGNLLQELIQCKKVPVTLQNNQTINIVALECFEGLE